VFDDFDGRVIGVELLSLARCLSCILLTIHERNQEADEPKGANNTPDALHVEGERLLEGIALELDDGEHLDGAHVEGEPREGAQPVAVVILDELVPLFSGGHRDEAPESDTELKQVVLSRNPNQRLEEEVVAVDDKANCDKGPGTHVVSDVSEDGPVVLLEHSWSQLVEHVLDHVGACSVRVVRLDVLVV